MKRIDLEKTIASAVRRDLKERMPRTFCGLYYDTLSNISVSFGYFDKYRLRQIVAFEILLSFPKRLSNEDEKNLWKIWRKAGKQLQESNCERLDFNSGNF